MHLLNLFLSLLSLLTVIVHAHFQIKSPTPRAFNEDSLGEYPCGGSNAQNNDRPKFPLAGGPIELDMGHDHSLVQVNLALGNVAVDGSAFNINVLPVVQQEGLGDFCLQNIVSLATSPHSTRRMGLEG